MGRKKQPRRGDTVDVRIEDLDGEARGRGRLGSRPVAVRGALAGELVTARIVNTRRGRYAGKTVAVQEPSNHRDPSLAACRHYRECGGCTWQDVTIAHQGELKRSILRHALQEKGCGEIPVARTVPSPVSWHYRNKVEFSFGSRPDGTLLLGYNAWGRFHTVVDIRECPIGPPPVPEALDAVRAWGRSRDLPPYDTREREGFLRFLILRQSGATGRFLVELVTSPPDHPFSGLPDGTWPREAFLEALEPLEPAGVLWTTSTTRSHAVKPEATELLTGVRHLEETVSGRRFRYDMRAFFQVNPRAFETIIAHLRKGLPDDEDLRILDLYCGVGILGLSLADRCARLHGVESIPEAVEAARANARRNGIENATFEVGTVESLDDDLPFEPDVVLLDPPRGGTHPRVTGFLRRLAPPTIVYVACNPRTMATDLEVLTNEYDVPEIVPFDLFPHTEHVEAVAILKRRPNAPTF